MDFQRLFKRKEESPLPRLAREYTREILNERKVLVREGELLDGQSPAPVLWSNVGGAISVKADKVLGILEGRTRIKAAVLQELYPELFEKPPNPATEFNIPLQAVVMQLEDAFEGISSEEATLEDFDTPFGQLAREDEARFKDKRLDRPEVRLAANSFALPQPESKASLNERDPSAGLENLQGEGSSKERKEKNPPDQGTIGSVDLESEPGKIPLSGLSASPTIFDKDDREIGRSSGANGTRKDMVSQEYGEEQSPSVLEESFPAFELRKELPGGFALSSGSRMIQDNNIRREGHTCLQELYLTDEPLDGSKVAALVLQLPRVAGVVIMLSDGAALGGGLSGGLTEGLLSLTPDFAKHLLCFTKSIQGGSASFATFASHAFQVSLTIDGDVLLLAAHEGKSLPPGLRERLVATAHALNLIYGLQS
jgi:hypothetical protein